MRRRALFLILTLLLAGGGVALIGQGVNGLGGPERLDQRLLGGIVLLLLSLVISMLNGALTRRDMRVLTRQLRQSLQHQNLQPLDVSRSDCRPMVRGVNEVLDYSRRAIENAALRVKELEIQLKIAQAERQHAEAIIYSISDAVLVTDPFDDIVLANESAARALAFDLNAAQRAPVGQILSDQRVVEMIHDMRRANGDGGRRVLEHTVRTPAGEKTFKITLSCVSDRRDAPAGVVAVLHDMTKEREIAQMKNDFVSSVSHELRTPLASIKAYIEMLIDGEADDEKTRSQFYEVIQNEANRLSRLIDNILNISRIESGLVKVNKQALSLTVVMKEAIEVIQPQARSKSVLIQDDLTPVFYQVPADKDMIYQAVLNLLSNAVKYTPEGGQITLRTDVDETRRKVTARITDTGVGIPPKDLPFVFDKFFRSEANNRMAKGTGLGLSLVKHIIETVHKGRMFVESQVGQGSTFGFELDLSE